MAKQSGLGDNLYFNGYDLSGDVSSVQRIAMPLSQLPYTTIDKYAPVRLQGLADGAIDYTAFWDDAAGQSFAALKANLNDGADAHVMYCRGTTFGNPGAALVAKRATLDWQRPQDGSLTAVLTSVSNSHGLDWGKLLTAGKRTDTAATNGTSLDNGASTALGWQAYLQVMAFTGTSVTVTIQDSADNSSWSTLTGGGFTAVTAAPAKERLEGGRTATVRRYVRVVTTGTFSNAVFAVLFNRNRVLMNV